jgi:RNA polymerase sigma factor (sigma-70 family)
VIPADPARPSVVQRAADAFAAYQSGDRASFDELVGIATPMLWHTVRGQGVDPVAAEDVVQTIWMRLLHSSASIRDSQTIVQWLLTAARREAWRTSRRTRVEDTRRAPLPGGDQVEGGQADVPTPAEQLTDETVLREDRQRRLWQHVQALPHRCRELLRVIAFADRPDYAVIATSLGMPVGSIGPTRGRCLAKLRTALMNDPLWEGSRP